MLRGILKWLIKADKKITSTEKLVLLILVLYQDNEGESCPSITEIAAATSLNRATVTRTLGNLEEKRIVIKSPRYNKNGHKSNSYQITPQQRPQRSAYTHSATMSGAESDTHSRTKRQSKKADFEKREPMSNAEMDEFFRNMAEEMSAERIAMENDSE